MLGVRLTDSKRQEAKISEGGLLVTPNAAPAPIDDQVVLPLARIMFLDNDGVTNNLNVDGSVNERMAYIQAEPNHDIYIKQVSIIVEATSGGSGTQLNMFGGIIDGLDVGLKPFFENENVRLSVSERPIKTNFDLIRLGSLSPNIGADETAFRIKNGKTTNSYGYLSRWDTTQLSSGNEGFALKAGTKQRFGLAISDDLTSLDAFEIFVIGFRRRVG